MIVLFLKAQPHFSLHNSFDTLGDFKDSKFLGVSLVAAMGFAFCYIASSPILTLHATRAHVQLSVLRQHWIVHSIALLVPVAVTTYFAWNTFSLPVVLAVGSIVGGQVGLVLVTLYTRFSYVEAYYRNLSKAGSKALTKKDDPASSGMEYITSYRHLREHGNAFGIVLLELVQAGVLYESCNSITIVRWLVAWLFPAAIAWLVGTVLESRFVSSPLPYMG